MIIAPALHFAHFTLSNPHIIPITKTLHLADHLRKRLLREEGWYSLGMLNSIFVGKNKDGKPLKGDLHASILPIDSQKTGYIDQIIVHSPVPFALQNLVALDRLQRDVIWGCSYIRLQEITASCPVQFAMTSSTWKTATPFLSFRHYRKNRDNDLKNWWKKEIDRFCGIKQLPPTTTISLFSHLKCGKQEIAWKEFALQRPSKKQHFPQKIGVVIHFAKEQSFPLSLGEYSHFGMGRFEPDV